MPRNRKVSKQARRGKQRLQWAWRQWIGLGVAAVVMTAVLFLVTAHPKVQALTQQRLDSDPSLGPSSAKVTIVEYGDFGCPTCQGWFRSGVLEKLTSTYGEKIRFVWKDFPIITAESPKAAEAGQCAFDQGKFWPYHDLLYQKAPALSIANLKSYAAQIGLNAAAFDRCLDSGQDAAKVQQSLDEAQRQYAFPGTPSFLINGKILVGPGTFETFQSMIDPILAGG